MTDETEITEEITPAPLVSVETAEFLNQTKRILETVIGTGNFDIGFEFISEIREQGETFSKAISIMFAGMENVWEPSEHEGQSFLQVAARETGFTIETIKRHTTNQWLLESDKIPEEFRAQIESGKQNSLEQIANTIKQGFELERDDWLRLSEKVRDDKEVGKIVRDIKGVPARSNLLMILVDERGVLWAWSKEEGLVEGGRLDVHSDSPAVKKMVARITGCAGIKPKEEF